MPDRPRAVLTPGWSGRGLRLDPVLGTVGGATPGGGASGFPPPPPTIPEPLKRGWDLVAVDRLLVRLLEAMPAPH